MEFKGWVFNLNFSFLSDKRLRVFLDWKLLQEWSFPRSLIFILGPTLLLLFINDLPDVVICNIAIYVDNTTLWQQILEFGSELESSHLSDTKGWGRIGLLMSMLEKLNLSLRTKLKRFVNNANILRWVYCINWNLGFHKFCREVVYFY